MKNKFAFSLAETLTTLMLIGVVAVVIIPVLNANVEKQKTISNLKRLYSSFSINIQTVLNEANCSSVSCLRAYPSGIVNQSQQDLVVDDYDEKGVRSGSHKEYRQTMGHVFANPKYFNVISQAGCKECLPETAVVPDGKAEDYVAYRLNNGTVMALYNYSKGNCTESKKVKGRDVCGIVLFDVNALKGPNIPGKDRFAYYISDEEFDGSYLIPVGYNDYKGISSSVGGKSCSTTGNADGYNCTAKILLDKWKIDY